ncbi:MAG: hypothetical protein PHQ91_09915 [Thermoanaerobaculaceae bacterium]|nr:hypothetical protein [Thermoanaerobaculaceae bacterium]TAM53132.1 MAG: glucosidase [Acidobacteriota bacterium]
MSSPSPDSGAAPAERRRLAQDAARERNWTRWGPYLAERQWGTVREDYSGDGDSWAYFPHDHARSRAYRWGEDGLLGICDREARLCFALALWNGRDPILKERLFGLANEEGNHGEDVKEAYYFLDGTPTASYLKALYKYPQAGFPYERLRRENRARTRRDPEFELADTGVLDDGRVFDVQVEYAKAGPDDILVRISVSNRGADAATLHLLPTLWFRNTWSWGRDDDEYPARPAITAAGPGRLEAVHETLGRCTLVAGAGPDGRLPELLFTDNETNTLRLFGQPNRAAFVKDAFHDRVVAGREGAVNPAAVGTKAAAWYRLELPPGGSAAVRLRLSATEEAPADPLEAGFDAVCADRIRETDEFYAAVIPPALAPAERAVARQAYAGLVWSRQFYNLVVREWLDGDPTQPQPPPARLAGRNADWPYLHARDVLSMPDTWEYPWFAAWDLAFHMLPLARLDPEAAKGQLVLLLREWYMQPNGQIPAYEWGFDDVNPPVHAWAAWRVYKMTGPRGGRDRLFLERVFQKLLLNFTWWVNRKDVEGRNLFGGGFLGLDNIGVFDRSKPLPSGGTLEQADGTSWMAFYCGTMLSIALELASVDPAYEDVASKFFEHYVAIADAINGLGGVGLWDEQDGFYYDQVHVDGQNLPIRLRSMVGLIPLFACEVLDQDVIDRLPGFSKRMRWFLEHRPDLAGRISCMAADADGSHRRRLLAIPSRDQLLRVLRVVLDEGEFLSPFGVRSLSRVYGERPFTFTLGGEAHTVAYAPGESDSGMFGGNSNWRGPVWFPVNFLLIEALERYHHFYGDALTVECPTGSGHMVTLAQAAAEIERRLVSLFLPDAAGRRPCHDGDPRFATDPHWRDLVLFYEYFHGDTGRGCGASHQTGWTALVTHCLETLAARRDGDDPDDGG